ncbi:hypothetical protein GEV33_007979 [Tenebrio molitor]|uniref:Uncharacterized protein n=1 Tax=Tenebrio molitor TaxID=7067 RepID=A0A8J6HI74_TENMO|nr:hypothetical protein GEV33_007979 [Tenebrio molitor]
MEDRGRHRIGISQNQPHINADVAPQKYNGTKGLLQENARRMLSCRLIVVISASKSASKVAEDLRKQRPVYIDRCGKSKEVAIMLDTVTSSVVESDSEPYVDSGDEYKPEEISESDSDNSEISESPFSLKDADTHKKNKKNIGSKRKLNKIDISESPFSLKDADTHKKNKKNIGSKRKLNKIDISESPFSLKDADTHEKNKKNIGSKGELNKQMQSNDPTEASEILNVDNKVVNKSTKKIARFNPETESYGAPSLALHMGTELKDCIDVAHNMTLKKGTLGSEINNRLTKNVEQAFSDSTGGGSDYSKKLLTFGRPKI